MSRHISEKARTALRAYQERKKRETWMRKIETELRPKWRGVGEFQSEQAYNKLVDWSQHPDTGKPISMAKAFAMWSETLEFTTSEENYKRQIIKHVSKNPSYYNKIRSLMVQAARDQGIQVKYNEVKIDWKNWLYDSTQQALVDPSYSVKVYIPQGKHSEDPDFVTIERI